MNPLQIINSLPDIIAKSDNSAAGAYSLIAKDNRLVCIPRSKLEAPNDEILRIFESDIQKGIGGRRLDTLMGRLAAIQKSNPEFMKTHELPVPEKKQTKKSSKKSSKKTEKKTETEAKKDDETGPDAK